MEEIQNDIYINLRATVDSLNKYFEDFLTKRGIDSYEEADDNYKWHLDGIMEAMKIILDTPSGFAIKLDERK